MEILSGCVIRNKSHIVWDCRVQIISEFGFLYELRGGMNLHNSGSLEANPANILHPFYAKLINMLEHFIIIQREFCLGTQLLFCKSNV